MLNSIAVIHSKSPGDGLDQYVFANVLGTSFIYMIDINLGQAVAKWDFKSLEKH